MRKIMAGPGFRIESATKSVEKNAQLFKLKFEYGDAPKNVAEITFLPSAGWLILRGTISIGQLKNTAVKMENKYDGAETPRNFKFSQVVDIDKKIKRIEFYDIENKTPDRKTFKIEGYHIFTRQKPEDRSYRTVWLVVLAIVGFAISVVLTRIRRSRRISRQHGG